MQTLLQDLRYSVRTFLRKPGFTAVAVVTLALGIGANTAIFSVINAVLLRSLAFEEPERLVKVWANTDRYPKDKVQTSPPNFRDWSEQNHSFSNIAAYLEFAFNITGSGEPERVPGAAASAALFPTLGISPALGRAFTTDEDKPGNDNVVVLSHALWQRRFAGDPGVLGQTIAIDGNSVTIIGVMPEGFRYPSKETEVWIPLALDPQSTARMSFFLDVIARLKPGVSLDEAQADMSTVSARLEQQYPKTNTGWGVNLVPLHEEMVGEIRPILLILMGVVGFVLLIACANVVNLLLVRAVSRQREIAIRSALGASRRRIVRQLLTESVTLSLAGGALGLFIAAWGVDLLLALSLETIPRAEEVGLDISVLAFTFGVSVLTGIVFGVAPALQGSRLDLTTSLKESGRGATGSRHRLRSALIVAEIAIALVLLTGGGLLLKSFIRLQQVNPGFDARDVILAEVALPTGKYKDEAQWRSFYEQALDRIAALPAIESAGATSSIPLRGHDNRQLFYIEGRPSGGPQDYTGASYRVITPGYFRALSIPVLQGRDFTSQDRDHTQGVVIINAAYQRRFFPGEDPLGKRLKMGRGPDSGSPYLTVIGVVADIKHTGLNKEAAPEMYLSYLQSPEFLMTLAVKSFEQKEAVLAAIRGELAAIDPDQPLSKVALFEQLLSDSVASQRFNTLLLGLFAALALALATVGIYGVMSYSAAQRTQEIGIRIALGAQSKDILKLIVGQGLALMVAGVVVGLAASFALTRLLESFLFGISATDAVTFAAVSLLLSAVTLLACYIPARRATKVDPMVALRYE
jgi:putative ABC transport system permease protein